MANNVEKLLTALLGPTQTLEDTLQDMLAQRSIEDAVGAQLDILGKLVGESRLGLSDDDYRRHIRARIVTNRSNGTIEDLIRITDLVFNEEEATIRIENGYCCVTIHLEDIVSDWDVAMIVIKFLRKGVAAGVRVILEFSTLEDEDTFSFFDGEGLGFGSTLDAGIGGGLISAVD